MLESIDGNALHGAAHLGARSGVLEATTHTLLKKLEGTLLGYIAQLLELLDCLQAGSVLPAADDATDLGLHQILLREATGRMMGGAVEYLGLGADSDLGSTIHGLASAILTFCHFVFYFKV